MKICTSVHRRTPERAGIFLVRKSWFGPAFWGPEAGTPETRSRTAHVSQHSKHFFFLLTASISSKVPSLTTIRSFFGEISGKPLAPVLRSSVYYVDGKFGVVVTQV